MDNKQGTVIGLGCLALCSLYYFYSQFSYDSLKYKSKRNQLRSVCPPENSYPQPIDYHSLKDRPQPVMVLLPNIPKYQLQKDTFLMRQRQIPQQLHPHPQFQPFLENQTGGKLTLKDNNVDITVDIKDCNIHTAILKQTVTDNIFFEQNKQKEAIYYSTRTVIKSAQNLAIYGALRYSFSQNKFTIQPEFIVKALRTEKETIDQMLSFWDDKIYKITFKKLAIVMAMVTLGYLLVYCPLKSIWQRYKTKNVGISEGQLEYFKQRVSFSAKISSALTCQFCKTNTISFIYECGHLVACEACCQDEKNHKCAICGKRSKKFMKIFI